jgi:SAM-dependent methyltransferase
MLPWRVKNFLSEHLPLLYHYAVNLGRGNGQEHWDEQLAATWDNPSRDWPAKAEKIASLCHVHEVILDIGCGNGSILRALRKRGYKQLHGLEISAYAIRRLREEGFEMHHGRIPQLPMGPAMFDVVIASQVLEHVIRRRRFLEEIRRVLKPGGRLLIFVPDDCLGPISEPEHVIKFTAETLRKLLVRHFPNVSIERFKDRNHPMPILFARAETASVFAEEPKAALNSGKVGE